MFGFLKLMIIVVPPSTPVDISEAKVFLDRYHPQVVLNNRFLAHNHKNGTSDYDAARWDQPAKYQNRAAVSSWAAYMRRTLPKGEMLDSWEEDVDWRYNCWNNLDTIVNWQRYGYNESIRKEGLAKLKALLTPEQWATGWMPAPIPDYGRRIAWLQELWTENTGFQGRKNEQQKVSPLD